MSRAAPRRADASADRRVLFIGLDAADRDFIAEHAADLPAISAIIAAGVGGELDSGPIPGAVWASFFTGSPPAEHGLTNHLQWDPARMRLRRVDGEWLPNPPFWREMGARGVPVIAFDIPFLFPGDAPNVLEIGNWGSHDLVGSFWANDRAVARRIRAEFGLHPMGFEVPVDKSGAELARSVQQMVDGAALKARLALWLMRERPWEVFLVAFGETHRGGHTIWPQAADADPTGLEDLKRIYRAVDDAVARIVAEAGEDADVVLFSPHGMAANSSQCHLTSIFMQRAIAHFRGEPAPTTRGDAPGLMRALRRRVPAALQFAVARAVPKWVRDHVVAREIGGGYRWAETLGFCLHGDLAGYLRLNLKGREAQGALEPEAAAALRGFLKAELEALTTADGRRLVRNVAFPAHDWPGARAHLLPDLLVEWEPDLRPVAEVRSATLGVIRGRLATGRGGNHRLRGFYVHRGPRQGAAPRARHICDLRALAEALA